MINAILLVLIEDYVFLNHQNKRKILQNKVLNSID